MLPVHHAEVGRLRIERSSRESESRMLPVHQRPISTGRANRTPACCLEGSRATTTQRPQKRKRQELNLQGRYARLFSKQLPSPIGWRFHQAAEAGIEPAGNVFNRHAQLPAVAPPQSKSARLDLNQRSRRPKRRGMPSFPTRSHQASGGNRTRTATLAK